MSDDKVAVRHSHWRNTGSTLVECDDCNLRGLKSQSQAVFIGRRHVETTGHTVSLVRRQTKSIQPVEPNDGGT
jgi:hypothetical protein